MAAKIAQVAGAIFVNDVMDWICRFIIAATSLQF